MNYTVYGSHVMDVYIYIYTLYIMQELARRGCSWLLRPLQVIAEQQVTLF